MLIASLLLVWFGWRKSAAARLAEHGVKKASFGQRLSALLHDPLKFGMLWQMVYMNFVVTAVGIFIAIRLDEVIRTGRCAMNRYGPDRALAYPVGDHRHDHPAVTMPIWPSSRARPASGSAGS